MPKHMRVDKTNSSDETLDLVDQNDQIIGETTRKEARQNPNLIHREIAILIHDDQKKILFQQRSRHKVVNPLKWTISCAGYVIKGEDSDKTAHRELEEELGFDTELKFVDKRFNKMPNQAQFHYCYIGKYSGEEIKIEKAEVEQAVFLSQFDLVEKVKSGAQIEEISLGLVNDFWSGKLG
ncbi:MAG: NUDIX domain-containing protein [bacterium]|nr:NUDIX domain-containing protein [bacterium]